MHPSPFGRRWWNHILRLKLEAHIFVHIISFPLCNFWGYAWRPLPSEQALIPPLKAVLFLNLFALKRPWIPTTLYSSPLGITRPCKSKDLKNIFSSSWVFWRLFLYLTTMAVLKFFTREHITATRTFSVGLNPWTSQFILHLILKQCWEVHLIPTYLDKLNINCTMVLIFPPEACTI